MANDWKKNLRIASYKGVRFYTEDAQYEFGNKLQSEGEECGRDTGSDEESSGFGMNAARKSLQNKLRNIASSAAAMADPDAFRIQAYMIGDTYPNRLLLIEKLKETDPGLLVHPTLGEMMVIPGRCKHRWRNSQGGIEYFELYFEKAQEEDQNKFPSVVQNTSVSVEESVEFVGNATRAAVVEGLIVTPADEEGVSLSVDQTKESLLTKLQKFLDLMNSKMNFGDVFDKISDFRSKLDSVRASLLELIASPAALMAELTTLTLWFRQMFNLPRDAFNQLEKLFDGTTINPLKKRSGTPTRQAISNNETLMNVAMRQAVFSQMVDVTSEIEFKHHEELVAYRNRLRSKYDALVSDVEASGEVGDEVYDALMELMQNINANLAERDQSLPRIQRIQTVDTIPSLVLVYNEYGTVNAEDSFNELNSVEHPLFVPAGEVKVVR